jgi:hypothetical protein
MTASKIRNKQNPVNGFVNFFSARFRGLLGQFMRIGDGLVPTEVTKTQEIAGTTPSPPRYRHIHESALRVPTHRFLPLQVSTPSIDSELDDAFAAHWPGSGQPQGGIVGWWEEPHGKA